MHLRAFGLENGQARQGSDLTDHTVIALEDLLSFHELLPRLLVRANGAPPASECLLVMCVNSARQEAGFLFLMGLLKLPLSGV